MPALRRPAPRITFVALILALAACDERTPSTPPPGAVASTLRVVGGDGQSGMAGAALPDEIAVAVLDAAGKGIPGFTVRFAAVSGGGQLGAETATSDADGVARTTWTLGTVAADSQVVEARLEGTPSVRLRAQARAAAPAGVTMAAGNGAAGPVGAVLADSLAVTVKDRFGNPVVGLEVAWAAAAGGGALSPARTATRADGTARAAWTLGPRVDSAQVALARVAGLDSVAFTANAVTAGAPLRLAKRGGDEQRGTAGAALADSLAVALMMPDGRPVAGALVTWNVPAGAGTVTPVVSRTDANGAAATVWRLGSTPGVAQATATVDEGTLIFNATVGVDAPAAIAAVAGGGEGPVGGALADSLAVRVTDQYGNPVPNAAVDWSVQAGGGAVSPARSTTDANGIARAQWTLGWRVGAEHAAAATLGTLPSIAFQATASTAGVTLQLARVGGNGQTGEAGAALADSLAVRLTSPSGAPVQGAVVRWAVAPGGGSVSAASTPTDAQGMARVRWTLGTAAGTMQATASVDAGVISFAAAATAGTPARVRVVGGDGQSTTRGTILADSLQARVEDAHGNPLAGQWVRWSVSAGGGHVEADSSRTDAQGVARVRWAVGLVAGTSQRVAAAVPGGPSGLFTATAAAGELRLTRINRFVRGGIGSSTFTSVDDTLVVKVATSAGAPVVGAVIDWERNYEHSDPGLWQTRTDWSGFSKRFWGIGFGKSDPIPFLWADFEGQRASFDAEHMLEYELHVRYFEPVEDEVDRHPHEGDYATGDTAILLLKVWDQHGRQLSSRFRMVLSDDNGWSVTLDPPVTDDYWLDEVIRWPLGNKTGQRTITGVIESEFDGEPVREVIEFSTTVNVGSP